MDPEHKKRVEEIFQIARKIPSSERASFLEKSCGDNHGLLKDVLKCLSSNEETVPVASAGMKPTTVISDRVKDRHPAAADLSGSAVGRIQLEERIGKGGMGEVYRGYDELLERTVAVKAIRGEQRMSQQRKARFLREARLLSKLDHPNICRVYDMVESEENDFLILEYIEGKTLHLAVKAGLSLQQKMDICETIAIVLAAAHKQKIVHRDLKPENIMLTPAGEVKVLDFGIARSLSDREIGDTRSALPDKTVLSNGSVDAEARTFLETIHTAPGSIMGTLRYMSPEQAAGKSSTEAGDIYSFGVIMQEIMTEKPTYDPDLTTNELLVTVVQGNSRPVENLDTDLTQLIDELLQLDLTKRPTAEAAAERLRWIREKPLRKKRFRLRMAFVASIATLLIMTFLFSWWLWHPKPLLAPGESARVVVLPFVNQTGNPDLEWVDIGLMDLVVQTLETSKNLEVVATKEVLKATKGLNLENVNTLTKDQLERLGKALGCQIAITSILKSKEENYLLESTIFDRRGLKSSVHVEGSELTSMSGRLSAALNQRLVPDAMVIHIKERFSSQPLANQLYAVGIQRLNTIGAKVAGEYFKVIGDLDPAFIRAVFQLAVCAEKLGQWDDAEKEALNVLDQARAKKKTDLEASSLQLLGVINFKRGDFQKAENYWTKAIEMFRGNDDQAGMARSLNTLGVVNFHRGERDKAEKLYEQALETARHSHDRLLEGEILINKGFLLFNQRDWTRADQCYTAALEIFRDIGQQQREGSVLMNFGTLAWSQGKLDEAADYFKKSLELRKITGDRSGEAMTIHCLGLVAWGKGKLDQAETLIQEALEIHRVLGEQVEMFKAMGNLGAILELRGELDRALVIQLEVKELQGKLGNRPEEAMADLNLGILYLRKGNLEQAASFLEAAREFSGHLPEFIDAEARLYYEKGQFRKAVQLAEKAKKAAGGAWNDAQKIRLKVYRRSVAAGRKIPIPEE